MKSILATLTLILATTWNIYAEPLKVGDAAPEFKIKDTKGKEINLAKLVKNGPVLVRLTCGCLGCDSELPYFQALHEAYKKEGIKFVAVFAEPDKKFAAYVKTKKLNMQYALDPTKDSWKIFDIKAQVDKNRKKITPK
jgi:peroxiredoxin